ncbi:hypothetical protein INT44_008244 [Umbelopsis vinacea]|uniref:Integrase catalytic domain-containing protein n=1 Tax=Umbelopsis vinacea TaxID=44442 RepID=A0A8H7UDB4_9FUNG|nr:hypothetical protein INT44_008244 [Umbelopsis vinacea]
MVGCDAVGPMQVTLKGNRYLLVAVDYLTKWPLALPVPSINRIITAKFMFDELVCRHEVPQYLLTGRGSNFTSGYVKDFLATIQCQHMAMTTYRPQTLVQTLAKTCLQAQVIRNWDDHLTQVLLAIRMMPNDVTESTPAKLLYGYEVRTPRFGHHQGKIMSKGASRKSCPESSLCKRSRATKTRLGVFLGAGSVTSNNDSPVLRSTLLLPNRTGNWTDM